MLDDGGAWRLALGGARLARRADVAARREVEERAAVLEAEMARLRRELALRADD